MTVSKQDLIARVTQSAIDVVHAENAYRAARGELRSMYDTFFAAYGRPDGNIDPEKDEWAGVIRFTATAHRRRLKARDVLKNAKARMGRAVRALERAI